MDRLRNRNVLKRSVFDVWVPVSVGVCGVPKLASKFLPSPLIRIHPTDAQSHSTLLYEAGAYLIWFGIGLKRCGATGVAGINFLHTDTWDLIPSRH